MDGIGTHDPRIQPRPGDVLRRGGATRSVYKRECDSIFYVTASGKKGRTTLYQWGKWAEKAEVLKHD